ncbi:glycoside hydrolase family 13 protein [Cystobasidium minutum MCA 4210]|uniref:glycoside hydrolase family 13 protein n=1 Tax=Cystobasidium minutum MCA 4210 TaxID=1397322 RepID=UPI0034CE98B5|eukprot:jgi/Rhomi1/211691/estExt_Genemark1.C_5_t10232
MTDRRIDAKWWKSSTIYQIYPSSFMDSNGDGIGDLPGILSKLDYIKSLGVDAVWISPFYKSPNKDQGYDISDYQMPDPAYGSMADVEAIIKGCHDRDMKIIFDLVINHTSDQHKWFQESRKSKDNPYRKYYIWKPARYIDGERRPPTNWEATFGGSAWEWDETTEEYYLHAFVVEQPDLNWEDAEVRQAIYKEAILFWLEKGIDGFRVDVSSHYSKHEYVDAPIIKPEQYIQPARAKYVDGPRLREYLEEMQRETFSKYDSVTLAEMSGTRTLENKLDFVGESSKRFSMAISFDLATVDHYGREATYLWWKPYDLQEFKKITEAEQFLSGPNTDGWALTYLENHDQARSISRFMNDSPEYRTISGKTLAMYLLTLSGTPIIYQGEEIGMINMPKSWPEAEYIDAASWMFIQTVRDDIQKGVKGIAEEEAFESLQRIARDHARVPMQWSNDHSAGFSSSAKTWMRVNPSYKAGINVAEEEKDECSVLNFYRRMLAFRKEHSDSLIFGEYQNLEAETEKTMQFSKKSFDGETLFVALNFSGEQQKASLPDSKGELLISSSTHPDQEDILQPYEGRIYRV